MLECYQWTVPRVFRCFAILSLSLLVVTTLYVGPSMAAGIDEVRSSQASFTEITECTKIKEPGEFALASGIEGTEDSPCIEIIGTDSVVLDGNGYMISNARVGVDIRRSSNITVKNLYVNGTERYGIGIWNSESIAIHGNNISNAGSGQGGHNNSILSWETTKIEIYNNTVINSSNYGIYAGRIIDGNIYRNTVINAHWSIFSAESKNIVIDDNKIENPDTDGNAIAGTHIINVTVTNNYVNDTRYGIEAKPNSTDMVIRGNHIENTVLCSIEAEGHNPGEFYNVEPGRVSNVVIEDNVMENTGPLGVWVNTSDIVIRNNIVKNASGLGMRVKGIEGNVEIYGNTIINSTWAAIWVNETQGNLQIYENNFEHLGTGIQ